MASCNHLVLAPLVLSVIIILEYTVLVEAQNFSFSNFNSSDPFLLVDDVLYYQTNYSFLLNARAAASGSNSCGKLFYKEPVRLKDSASNAVASFHTAFTFQINGLNYKFDPYTGKPQDSQHADGMAFHFGRNSTFNLGHDATGKSLCLLRSEDDGQASNRLFAVEFDTYQNTNGLNDSSNNHIGVDINSLSSGSWYYNLCGGSLTNCSYLVNGGYFTSWIDYDSATQTLEVFFANGSMSDNIPKPPKPVINVSLALTTYTSLVDDYMYVGFTGSAGLLSEVHEIQSWTFETTGMPDLPTNSKVGIIVGISVGAVLALALLGYFIARCWRRKSYRKQDKFNLVDQNLVPRMFTIKELSKATENFNKSELLGTGGFGAVYKGTLPSGALVAVKKMALKTKQGEESFQAEAASLSQIRHRNLVQLRGWCHEEEQLFLVYDYMCNGDLDEWLYHYSKRRDNGKATLSLNHVEALPLGLRHSVLTGVAAALSYLHEECVQCVLHRDIKSSNVLLDATLNAYLGDFGLARLIDHQKMEKTTMMAGTLGYMAPEMPHTGKATKESDVYSFGVLMLEVMCGARPLDMTAIEQGDGILVDRVWRAHEAGNILQVADIKLGTFPRSDSTSITFDGLAPQDIPLIASHTPDTILEDKKLITNLLQLGLLCCNPNPEDRPPTRLVSQLLQSSENMEMWMPPLPTCKPRAKYFWPGYSQFDIAPSSDSSSGIDHIHDVDEQGLLINGDHHQPAHIQSSFVASSEIFESGRETGALSLIPVCT
ncbi:hypothetical protein M758_2G200700 [Ceratodon purpureus]|nr:hypothetical protein M758_2G200700 [Ceratodon purpureus]